MIERIFLIISCHLMGDYFLQSNFLATTKGENWYHLFVHCFLYTIPFYIVFGWCWQLALIGILHFPIDTLKAKWGKQTMYKTKFYTIFWPQVICCKEAHP